jgi:hypothetical protein
MIPLERGGLNPISFGQVGWLERNIPAQHRKIQYCLLGG